MSDPSLSKRHLWCLGDKIVNYSPYFARWSKKAMSAETSFNLTIASHMLANFLCLLYCCCYFRIQFHFPKKCEFYYTGSTRIYYFFEFPLYVQIREPDREKSQYFPFDFLVYKYAIYQHLRIDCGGRFKKIYIRLSLWNPFFINNF